MNRNNRQQTRLNADEDNNLNENAQSTRRWHPRRCRLRLNMGGKTIPNPQGVCEGGEDATFIANNAMGVFDGMGGGKQQSDNSGMYSRALARMTGTYLTEWGPDFAIAALRFALENSPHDGTSTACVAGLTKGHLRGINVGDTGLIVVRHGSVVFQTVSRKHSFDVPYQLGTGSRDRVDQGQWFNFLMKPGDVIIMGTGGLWSNLEVGEITSFLKYSRGANVGGEMSHQMMEAAKYIALQAHNQSLRTSGTSPFTRAALKAGVSRDGGKIDDISVIVSMVVG